MDLSRIFDETYCNELLEMSDSKKETKKYIEALKVNDKILTIGGIYGTISKMNDDGTIIIAVEDGSKMKISKNAVSQDATLSLNQTT